MGRRDDRDAPTIAACLIVKNAAETIERCLSSVLPHVDELVLYDTGSSDGTLDLLERLERRQRDARVSVVRGEWRDDFGWARDRAFELASADWLLWVDADDVLVGAETLRLLVANAAPELDGFVAAYEAQRDAHGNVTQHVWRIRLVRQRSQFHWQGVVHERLVLPDGRAPQLEAVPAEKLRVVHQPVGNRSDPTRNLRIMLAHETRTEPAEDRFLLDLAVELVVNGQFEEAMPRLTRYLGAAVAGSDEKAQARSLLAVCLRMCGRPADGAVIELEALQERPDWTEAALGLAESYAALGQWNDAYAWAARAHELGVPQRASLVDTHWLSIAPLLRMAEASLMLNSRAQADEALAETRRRFGTDEWLNATLDDVAGDTTSATAAVRAALHRYDPRMQAAVRAFWQEVAPV